MVNIRDIAKEANVSVSTVSRVLNNHPYVSDAVRSRVQQIMDDFNYVSNSNAVKLSKGKTQCVGLVVPEVDYYGYDTVSKGIIDAANKDGYNVMLLCSNYDIERELLYLEMLRKKELDGLIFISKACEDHYLTEYSKYGPITICREKVIPGITNVYPRRIDSYYEIYQHFLDYGCTDIFTTTNKSVELSRSTQAKWRAYEETLNKPATTHFFHGVLSEKNTEEVMNQIINQVQEDDTVGVFVDSDEIGASLIVEAKKKGLIHHKNFFIISEGNTYMSTLMNFMSIDYNLLTVGRKLYESLFSEKMQSVVVDYEIMEFKNII